MTKSERVSLLIFYLTEFQSVFLVMKVIVPFWSGKHHTVHKNFVNMKFHAIKVLTSSSMILCVFITLSTLLMLSLLNSNESRSGRTGTASYQHRRDPTTVINKHNAGKAFEPEIFPPKGIGTIRAIKTESSYDCAIGTDGPILSSPICSTEKEVTLLILVTSAPGHFQQRKAIRNTWGRRRHISNVANKAFQGSSQPWITIFMVGSTSNISMQLQIAEEARREGDILLGDFIDDYRNLTVKVQQGLCWALRNCNAKYVLKTDDDCFVNTELITQFLEIHNKQTSRLYVGYAMKTLDVIRSKMNKWHVSKEAYPYSRYPPYASGTGYLLSRDVLQKMVHKAPEVQYFPMEDAYTGVLASKLGIPIKDTSRFVLNNVNWSVCNYLYLMVIHQVSPEQQYLGLMYSEEALDPAICPQSDVFSDWN